MSDHNRFGILGWLENSNCPGGPSRPVWREPIRENDLGNICRETFLHLGSELCRLRGNRSVSEKMALRAAKEHMPETLEQYTDMLVSIREKNPECVSYVVSDQGPLGFQVSIPLSAAASEAFRKGEIASKDIDASWMDDLAPSVMILNHTQLVEHQGRLSFSDVRNFLFLEMVDQIARVSLPNQTSDILTCMIDPPDLVKKNKRLRNSADLLANGFRETGAVDPNSKWPIVTLNGASKVGRTFFEIIRWRRQLLEHQAGKLGRQRLAVDLRAFQQMVKQRWAFTGLDDLLHLFHFVGLAHEEYCKRLDASPAAKGMTFQDLEATLIRYGEQHPVLQRASVSAATLRNRFRTTVEAFFETVFTELAPHVRQRFLGEGEQFELYLKSGDGRNLALLTPLACEGLKLTRLYLAASGAF